MDDSRIRKLKASIVSAAPRVLLLTAPPGYDKTALARAYANEIGREIACTLPVEAADLARSILDAFVSTDSSRAARSAVDRLARRQPNSSSTSREALRHEWLRPVGVAELVVLRDPTGVLATPAGLELLVELVGTLPPDRRLALLMRVPPPPALETIANRLPSMTVQRSELALDRTAVARLARSGGLNAAGASALYELAEGWPLVTRLLADAARRPEGDDLFEELGAVPHEAMLSLLVHRTVAALPGRIREALIAASFFARTDYRQLVRVLGPECDDAVFARMSSLPFVERLGEAVSVHPEATLLLRARFESIVKKVYERTLSALCEAGSHIEAARIALASGDDVRAAETIDAAPPYTAAPIPLGEYERVIDRIDRTLITRFPNLWIATIPYRSFSVAPVAYIREAETVYYCLPASSSTDQRAAVVMLLASAYVNMGRSGDAEALLAEALQGFGAEPIAARASLLNLAASLKGIEGRFSLARSLAQEAIGISRDGFGENQTLHYIEAHEAAYRGKQDRLVVILDELLRRRSREELPLYLAYIAMNGALFSWVNGDDSAFDRYQTAFEDAITPAIEIGLAPLIDAARGRPFQLDEQYPWPLVAAVANLYQLAHARTHEEALRIARAAAEAADLRRAPYTRTLVHVALFLLDETARDREEATLREIISSIESSELRDAVEGLVQGGSAGILESFVRRRVLRERTRSDPRLSIELLTGLVGRNGEDLRLRDKEFELVALLASTRGPLSREQIGEALWGHLEPEEWRNNFKVTVYRVRKSLASRDVIITNGAVHRLAPGVDVDLRRAEMFVRERAASPLDESTRIELRRILATHLSDARQRYERFTWSHSLIARLTDVLCTAGNALALDALSRDRPDEALEYAAEVRAVDGLNEQACEVTLRALLMGGRADEARREFRRYAEALARELETVPPASLAALVPTA
jgi:DNA-binding SARP family transcriptional activator